MKYGQTGKMFHPGTNY